MCFPDQLGTWNRFPVVLTIFGALGPFLTLMTTFIPNADGVCEGPLPKSWPEAIAVLLMYVILCVGIVSGIIGCCYRCHMQKCCCACCNCKNAKYTELDDTLEQTTVNSDNL